MIEYYGFILINILSSKQKILMFLLNSVTTTLWFITWISVWTLLQWLVANLWLSHPTLLCLLSIAGYKSPTDLEKNSFNILSSFSANFEVFGYLFIFHDTFNTESLDFFTWNIIDFIAYQVNKSLIPIVIEGLWEPVIFDTLSYPRNTSRLL